MKPVLKILKLSAIFIITATIMLFSASLLLQDKVAYIILKSLNNNIATKLDFRSFNLSFLSKFPKASLELKDVLIHSSSNFNSAAYKGLSTDTLLAARIVSVDFKITDILNGNYNIERIGVRSGKINLYCDTSGLVNYDVTTDKQGSVDNAFTVNLERINLTDIRASYNNLATKLIINGLIKNGRLKSRISGNSIDFTADAELQIDTFQLYNAGITRTIAAEINLSLESSKSGILFRKGTLRVEDYEFGLDGFISSDNMADLNISGHNIDIANISNYLPEKYLKFVSDYGPSGQLIIDCTVKGLLTRRSGPHIEISCSLNNGRISYTKSDLIINDLSFTGYFSNGSKNQPGTSFVSIKDLTGKLGSSEFTGAVTFYGLENPKTELILKGRVFPGELKEFFNIRSISTAEGSVDFDLKLVKFIWPREKITLNDIIDLKPEADIVFNSLTIGFQNNKMLFSQINGNLSLSNSILSKNFQLTYKGQIINIDGEFRNLPEWLAGRPVQLMASADVSFNRFIPEVFLNDSNRTDSMARNNKSFLLPGDIVLDINFKIDSLNYKTFSSSEISGTLNYKPRLITIKSVNMKSLNGIISGNGFIVQNNSKSINTRGNFKVSNIDVNNAFKTFHNFGQDFLKAENLAGSLSGSFSILLPLDSMLIPRMELLTAEGKYLLLNGALINFDPVKQLSAYVELSELENIHFQELKNDFFIRNNSVYIPQMDVKSSAADLSVNGTHNFNNNYVYHVKMLLSDILSKKMKRNKSNVSEFGIIEDDGLGRTSLLLKIENKGDDVKVGYDIKAAGNEVKNNIRSEKQKLKTILNQEYGWFGNDSTVEQKPSGKSRFRITWEENDSVKMTPDIPAAEKKSTNKSLFRKK